MHPNRPTDLSEETDFFGTLQKAISIQTFLENSVQHLDYHQMLALYGNWGSGKTSLMRYLDNRLDRSKFFPIFFEAWHHEKDQNLAYSISDCLQNQLQPKKAKSIGKELLAISGKFLIGAAKSVSFKGPWLAISPKEILNELEKEEQGAKSFFEERKEFVETFQKVEDQILKEQGLDPELGKIIIFVDDLDRCEPESVLNLLAAMKLFFTYGRRTVFFCGIDKKAIQNAIEVKYKSVIKSEEYLEKIFDISFRMPQAFLFNKFISERFKQNPCPNSLKYNYLDLLHSFFNGLNFTNPRHVIKTVNKYALFCAFLDALPVQTKNPRLLKVDGSNPKGTLLETILVLFFIILIEFKPELFDDLRNYQSRVQAFSDAVIKAKQEGGASPNESMAFSYQVSFENGLFNTMNSSIASTLNFDHQFPIKNPLTDLGSGNFNTLLFYFQFLPGTIDALRMGTQANASSILNQFDSRENELSVRFCRFLSMYRETLAKDMEIKGEESDVSVFDLMRLCQNYL